MGSNRNKRISIHDYPEHLNPFSEPNLTVQDKRRIFVDKLRKNGTWSSKISKRVSRSVTWIEKSWLAAEEPPKGYPDSRIDDKHNIRKYDTRMCVKSNPVIREVPPTEHDSLARRDGYQRAHTREPHELDDRNIIATTERESAKLETKKRKKRPAPLPPNITDNSSSPSKEKPAQSFSSQTKIDGVVRNSEDTSRTEAVVMENSDHCESNDAENKNDTPVSNIAGENHEATELVSSPTEESSGKAAAETPQQISDHLERLHLDSSENNDSQKSSETSESERLEILANGTCNIENVEQEKISCATPENSVLDENANISCSKLEKNVSDSTVKIHCNGNAVQV